MSRVVKGSWWGWRGSDQIDINRRVPRSECPTLAISYPVSTTTFSKYSIHRVMREYHGFSYP